MSEYKLLKDWDPKPGDRFIIRSANKAGVIDGSGKVFVFDSGVKCMVSNAKSKYSLISRGKKMKYEDKWHLNDGSPIPKDADTLEKDGSVVAYRLPVKEIGVGSIVRSYAGGSDRIVICVFYYEGETYCVNIILGDDIFSVHKKSDLILV